MTEQHAVDTALATLLAGADPAGDFDGRFLYDGEAMLQTGQRVNQTICAGAASGGVGYRAKDIRWNPTAWFYIVTVLTLTSGSIFIMWLGEQMTEQGIGNGTSLIIFAIICNILHKRDKEIWARQQAEKEAASGAPPPRERVGASA